MSRRRRGFTLIEMMVVMLILGIVTALVAQSFGGMGYFRAQTTTGTYLKLLHDSRQFAIANNTTVSLQIDPLNGHFRVDTAGQGGTGVVVEDSIRMGNMEQMQTDQQRLHYIFFPTGAAFADSVILRASDSTRLVWVEPWSGNAYTFPR